MTPADLATHYSADDLLAALCAKLSTDGVAAVVRAAVPFMQGEDRKVRERRLAAERSRRSYEKSHAKKVKPHASESTVDNNEQPSEPHGETSEPHGESDGSLTVGPAPSPPVSPAPPSSPTPPPTLSPAHTREDTDILSVARQMFPHHPQVVAEVPAWVEHCRQHAEKRGKTFTFYTARTQLMDLARIGPDKALLAIRSSAAKGSASIIDPDEKRFASLNGHSLNAADPSADRHPQPATTTNGNRRHYTPETHRADKRSREFAEPALPSPRICLDD